VGFNKTFLPTVQELQKCLKDNEEGTINWLRKSDCFIGPEKSQKFVEYLLKTKRHKLDNRP